MFTVNKSFFLMKNIILNSLSSKDALNRSKVTVNTFIMLTKVF